ncbi:MAG TPA: preprotein translocase subunit SecE [Patescibacteria group bacterium]|nr:preprotein translocase subunit SecE [Patescibacteria group bacterium]
MVEEDNLKKQLKRHKSHETVREFASKQAQKNEIPARKLKGKIHRPLSVLGNLSKKEYNPIHVPESKAGRILGKRIHIMPKFLKEAWVELKLVTWPSRREAARLTGAVLIFAIIFAIFVQLIGILFDKLFKVILLGK